MGLARHGIDLLGTPPYRPILSNPTLSMLVEQLPGEVLDQGNDRTCHRTRGHRCHAAPTRPERIGPGSLLIVPGDRKDVIHATLAANRTARALRYEPGLRHRLRRPARFGRVPHDRASVELAGMVFSGGQRPGPRDLEAIRQSGLFAYLVAEDTYQVASEVHGLLVKTHRPTARRSPRSSSWCPSISTLPPCCSSAGSATWRSAYSTAHAGDSLRTSCRRTASLVRTTHPEADGGLEEAREATGRNDDES
jgi:hypothetical protein